MAAWHTNADLYHQWEEADSRATKWEETAKKEKKEHKQAMAALAADIKAEVAQMRAEHRRETDELRNEIADLKQKNQLLEEENSRLRSIINNDSNNSSNPPSSDQKPRKRANEYNNRQRSGKKRGGQQGREGKTLKKEDAEKLILSGRAKHEIVDIGEASTKYTVKYVLDTEINVVVREYRYHDTAEGNKCRIPECHRCDVNYGNGIKGIVSVLYGVGVLSNERIQNFIKGITDGMLNISAGGIYGMIQQFAACAKPAVNNIKETILNHSVVCTDATSATNNGKQQYIRNFSTENSVIYVGMSTKTIAEMKKTMLPRIASTLVHDHETSLYHFGTQHAECNVHMLRYLTKNSEDTKNPWSEKLSKWLCAANKERKKRMEESRSFTSEELDDLETRYLAILQEGWQENEKTKPKWAQKEEAALLRRLEKYREAHLLFLRRFDVPFDNNMSERDLRKVKNRQKMSGGFRSDSGRDMFCTILSFIETCKRRHIAVFQSIRRLLDHPDEWVW